MRILVGLYRLTPGPFRIESFRLQEFMQTVPSSTVSRRQAFFARFSAQALRSLEGQPEPKPLILLTGGLRTPAHLHGALRARHAHLLGFGRASVLRPDLPSALRARAPDDSTPFTQEPELDVGWWFDFLPRSPLIGAGVGMAWYVVCIRRIAAEGPQAVERHMAMGGIEAVLRMFLWITS